MLLAVAIATVLIALGSRSTPIRVVDAQVKGAGSASLRVSGGHTELVVRRFVAPPVGEIYEVWLQHGRAAPAPTPALFGVNRAGDADVDVPGSMRGVSRVMVTREPVGGSPKLTHPPIITATLD